MTPPIKPKTIANAPAVAEIIVSPQTSHSKIIQSNIATMTSNIGPIISVTKSHTTFRAVPTISTTAFHAFKNVVMIVSPAKFQKISTPPMMPTIMFHTSSTATITIPHTVFQTC